MKKTVLRSFFYNMFFVSLFFLIFSCKERNNTKVLVSMNDLSFLENKMVNSIYEILNDSIPNEFFILLYNGYDCLSCIDAAFYWSKKIEDSHIYVISSMSNTSFYQKRYGYYDYIFTDEKDIIRRDLKFIPTPIILKMKDSLIIKAYNPIDTINNPFK